jgi:hypothetical protein
MEHLLETTCNLKRVAILFNRASGSEDCATRRNMADEAGRSG